MKGKILCLHGFIQSGPIFSAKAAGLRKTLNKQGYETIFLTSPIKLTPADLPFDTSDMAKFSTDSSQSDFRAWWFKNSDDTYDLEAAFESIKACIKEEGPIVGILGFSQGGGLAGVMTEKFHEIVPDHGPLKFAIYYSGIRVNEPKYRYLYEPAITVPTLHILGELDTVVSEERSMELYDMCDEKHRTLLKHAGGHFVPNSKLMINNVINWIEKTLAGPVVEEKKDLSLDDLDSMMSGFGN